jgi:hypothetical protein
LRSFAESPDAVALPTPIVRGIAGRLYGTASTFLRQPPAAGRGRTKPADEMLRWTLPFQMPAAVNLLERMAPGLTARMREISSAAGHKLGDAEAPSRDERTRLLKGILRLVTREEYRTLSAPMAGTIDSGVGRLVADGAEAGPGQSDRCSGNIATTHRRYGAAPRALLDTVGVSDEPRQVDPMSSK